MHLIQEHIIIRALRKTANEEDERQLNDWLRESPANVEFYCRLQTIWDSGNMHNQEIVSREWADLYRKISVAKSKRRLPAWVHYAAAVFTGILIASGIVMFALRNSEQEPLIQQSIQNIAFNNAGVQKLILPDSSVVWLNESTRLSYPEKFSGDKRMVSLEGKVFFEIRKDEGKPFVVQTNNVDVQVTGTTFFVESENECNTVVTLVSGGVTVYVKDEKGKTVNSTKLVPGQQAEVNKNNSQLSVANVDTNYFVLWKDGTYRFTNEPLEMIAKQLSRHYGMKIELSKGLKNKRFTGRITQDLKINDVMEIINKSHPVKYSIEKNTFYIRERHKDNKNN
jgi:ferric-dicitrate binding protein FerR (iron transport regulator)